MIIILLYILSIFTTSWGADFFTNELDSDTAYLPYQLHAISNSQNGVQRVIQYKSYHVISPMKDNKPGEIVFSYNPKLNEDTPGAFCYREYPTSKILDEDPIPYTFNDWDFYHDTASGGKLVVTIGHRNDSAFAIKNYLGTDTGYTTLFITSGKDRTGNGRWDPLIQTFGISDYDHDGQLELFYYINAVRDMHPRVLGCLDITNMKTEWILPVASIVQTGMLKTTWRDSQPVVLFTSYNTAQGAVDSIFSDSYCYVTALDQNGIVINNKIVNKSHAYAQLLRAPGDTLFYITHLLPFTDPHDSSAIASATESNYISLIDAETNIIQSIELDCRPINLWLDSYQNSNIQFLYVLCKTGRNQIIKVFDATFVQVAESDTLVDYHLTEFRKKLLVPGHDDSVLFFRNCITTQSFEKLMELPVNPNTVQPVAMVEGQITELALDHNDGYYIGRLSKKTAWDLLTIFFIRYRLYIISFSFSLLIGLIVANIYRSKNKSMVRLISTQKTELEDTYTELKNTQQKLIDAEKYKQAKDIAGGFAHEIRNALFPVPAYLKKIAPADKQNEIAIRTIKAAHDKVLRLTDTIKQYTALEVARTAQPVDLHKVIEDELLTYAEMFSEKKIQVEFNPTKHLTVWFDSDHLSIVLKNIILNATDALIATEQKQITIKSYERDNKIYCTVEDNGCGISDTDLAKVFDAFYTTKPNSGTGIGLSIVKKIIENYESCITLSSYFNKGTTVSIVFKKWEG